MVQNLVLNHVFIYILKILTGQKDPNVPEKARSKFGQHFLLAKVTKETV